MGDIANTAGQPITVPPQAPVALDLAPTNFGAPPPGPLEGLSLDSPDFGIPVSDAARTMTGAPGGVVILTENALETDPRYFSAFRQQVSIAPYRGGTSGPVPRPEGRGEGARAAGEMVQSAIDTMEKGTVRKF
eukprot:jgi/Mesvir1/5666/Mv15684-RA.1